MGNGLVCWGAMLVIKQGIYEIRNTASGAVYVGQSVDTEKRMYDHRLALVGDRHPNKLLQEDWNDYGSKAFTFEHVETVYHEALLLGKERERIGDYEKNNVKLYNRAGVHRIMRKPLKKTILFNPFQGRNRKPLTIKYLTFKNGPTLPEKAVSEPVVEKSKPEKKIQKPSKAQKQERVQRRKEAQRQKKARRQKEVRERKAARQRALKEAYPIRPPKTGRGCPHHPGIVCWHMVLYGGVGEQYAGMTFEEYDEAQRGF